MKRRSTSEYVFPSPTGGPISPDSVLHMLQRVLKRAGLEKIPFHSLRHTFSVLALQNGVDIKTLSAMLGHYSAGFTLDTYAHVTTAMQTKAANTSGAIQGSCGNTKAHLQGGASIAFVWTPAKPPSGQTLSAGRGPHPLFFL